MYFNAGIIPVYVTYKNLGLINNYLVYLLPSMVSPFNLVLCKTYIESIPQSLEESAEIDGAGYFIRFTRIIFPLIKPIVALQFFGSGALECLWIPCCIRAKQNCLRFSTFCTCI